MNVKSLEVLQMMGALLADEPDWDRFLEILLHGAKSVTNADGGILYKVEEGFLNFFVIQTGSTRIVSSGSLDSPLPSTSMFDAEGAPRKRLVAPFAALNDTTVNIPDIYTNDAFDFSAIRQFDMRTGYRTRSFLIVPVKDVEGRVAAVLQLINARHPTKTDRIVPFSREDQRTVEALARLATEALAKHHLTHHETALDGPVVVHGPRCESLFSMEAMAEKLTACAIAPKVAGGIAAAVMEALVEEDVLDISREDLDGLVARILLAELGRETAAGFAAWSAFRLSGLPLVVLIGGAAGVGKSAVATELAMRLGIERTHTTGTLREGMRALTTQRERPILHASSLTAWQALPDKDAYAADHSARLIKGFTAQCREVETVVERVLARSIREGEWAIVEGIHIDSDFAVRLAEQEQVVVVPMVFSLPDQEALWRHVEEHGRGSGRKKDADQLRDVWTLQSHLLRQAHARQIPVILNINKALTVRQSLDVITQSLIQRFPDAGWNL